MATNRKKDRIAARRTLRLRGTIAAFTFDVSKEVAHDGGVYIFDPHISFVGASSRFLDDHPADEGSIVRRRLVAERGQQSPHHLSTKTQSPLREPPVAPQPLQELGDARIHSWCGACRRTRYDTTLCKEPNETTHPAHVVRRYKLAAPATGALASVVLCQEDARASCCMRDEGRPFGAAL